MKNGKVINILEFVWVVVGGGWWWIPLHYLVTSEIDFRLSEAVTTSWDCVRVTAQVGLGLV